MPDPATPTRAWRRRASLAALVLLFLLTAAADRISPKHGALIRNLCLLTGIGVVLAQRGARAIDLPWVRRRWAGPLVAALTAAAATLPTLGLPYFADDWQLLEMRGRQPSLLASMSILPGEPWFRPVGWTLWWIYDKASAVDARLAHGVNIALFASAAALVVPALRRCGAPRGLATAAAILFAVHPAGLDTAAWVTNVYSLLAVNGLLAALAWLPFGRATWRRRLTSCAFALAAFLSKEDSYLFPVVVVVVAARFQPRYLLTGIRAAWPFAVAAGAVALTRYLLLENGAPYRDPASGESMWMRRITYGPRLALETELPVAYVLPLRGYPTGGLLSYAWSLLPAAILAVGGLTPGLGRQVRRAAPFVVMGLLPVAPLLPIGRTFETIRWLFFPSIGIALLTASALAGFPLRGRWRWLPILLYAALSAAAGRANFAAWRESASLLTGGLDAIAPHVKAMPSEGRAWVLGIPWMVRGAYCANCGVPQLYQRAHERRDAEFLDAASAVGTLDLAIAYDAKEGRAESFVRAGEGVVLGLTAPWSADFAAGSTPADVKLYALPSAQLPKALRLQAGLPGAVALPPMSAPAGSRLRVDLESVPRVADDGASGPRLHITQLTPSGLTRMRRPVGREFPLAPGVELFRLDLTVPYGEAVELSRVKVSVVP